MVKPNFNAFKKKTRKNPLYTPLYTRCFQTWTLSTKEILASDDTLGTKKTLITKILQKFEL